MWRSAAVTCGVLIAVSLVVSGAMSVSASGGPSFRVAQTSSASTYEVYAVRYGVLPQFRVSGLVAGADTSRRLDIPVVFWVVKAHGGRVFLVDCGFYRQRLIERWKPTGFIKPSEAISGLGLQPSDVTDVVITHMHWDHAGSLDLFPKAAVWIQRDEFTYYTTDAWQAGGVHGGIEPDDVQAVVRANTEGRLRLLAREQEIAPGLEAHQGGCHTHASQFLSVKTEAGTVVLASDNIYLYENLEKQAPIAGADHSCNLDAQKKILGLASALRLIVPGHDPDMFNRFTTVAPGIVRIK